MRAFETIANGNHSTTANPTKEKTVETLICAHKFLHHFPTTRSMQTVYRKGN